MLNVYSLELVRCQKQVGHVVLRVRTDRLYVRMCVLDASVAAVLETPGAGGSSRASRLCLR